MTKFIFTALFTFVLACGALTAAAQIRTGGYKSIAADDPEAAAAAEFAVSKRAETDEGLSLSSVETAERQIVAGTNFRLCMQVALGDESQFVSAVVYRNLQQQYQLTSWNVVDGCGGDDAGVSSRVPRKVAPCTGAQLKLAEANSDADMGGKRYLNFVFTNTSAKSCTMTGFPTVVALDKAGKVMKSVAVQGTNDYPNGDESVKQGNLPTVTLAAGKQASFQIYYNDGMAIDHKKPFPKVAKLRVIATADKKAFVVGSDPFETASGLQVSSIRESVPDTNDE